MDPGTALAIVGLGLDAVKDLHSYYVIWKDRDRDVEEVGQQLIWLMNLFHTIQITLKQDDLNPAQVQMICGSIKKCEEIITKLKVKLAKVKREGDPDTLLKKWDDQRRRALYPFKKGTIGGLLDLIDSCKEEMKMVIPLLNLDASGRIRKGLRDLDIKVTSVSSVVDETKAIIVGGTNEKERKRVMDWLNPINQADIHAAASRKHEPGTGEWFLEGEVFRNWRQDSATSLWLFGDVGCGKTVLFSSIVNFIENQERLEATGGLSAYFYCLYRKGAQHDLAPILQSFIAQLCPFNHIPAALQSLYDRHNSKFPPGIPSDDELKETFLTIVYEIPAFNRESGGSDRNIFILVDALDELPLGTSRDDIIGFLDKLASYRIPHLHVLATGRDESDIRSGLKTWDPPLSIDKNKVIEDMRLFVVREIEKDLDLSSKPAAAKELIIRRLVDEGNGMFRWTALQMEQLKVLRPMKPSTIREALRTLPKDLDETYENILVKISPLNSKEALSVLRWISFATRPLFIEELIELCAINLDADPEFETEERYKPSDILDLLPGLITINPPLKVAEQPLYKTNVVTFSHFSVQEYLLGKRIVSGPASLYSLEIRFSNHFIATCCLAYLHCCNSFELRKEGFPLRQYAWDYWAWHTVFDVGKSNQELSADAEALFRSIAHQPNGPARDALKILTSRLAGVKNWRSPAESFKQTFEACLKVPFFLDEFDSTSWDDAFFRTHSTPPLYNYRPLGKTGTSIRLIELFPSLKRYTEVRCRIFHTDLAFNTLYDAVSYFWGDLEPTFIRVNGLLREVHGGLLADLRNLRPSEGENSRILFVDALSFDCGNPERPEHSARMHLTPRIFKQAQQVAIGLGDRDKADASAIKFIRRVTSMSNPEANISENKMQWSGNDHEWADCMGVSVLHLFQRHWWRRLWPAQELILPLKATLYYGDIAITFDTFQKFFEMTDTIKSAIGATQFSKLASEEAWIGATRISAIRTQYWQGRHPELPELIWATQYHQVRDPIIKINALVGLLTAEDQNHLWYCLNKQSSTIEKFKAVTVWIVRKYNSLDVFSYASCRRWKMGQRPADCTSWVPNFGLEGRSIEPLIHGGFGPKDCEDLYNAGEKEAGSFSVSEDDSYLTVSGIRVDHVLMVEDTFTGQESNLQLLNFFNRATQNGLGKKPIPSQSTLGVFWRTLHLDQKSGRRLQNDNEHLVDFHPDNDKDGRVWFQKDGLFDLQYCKGRCLLISKEGYLCLGPVGVKAGDLIAIMPGGKVPYLLRKSKGKFELVGECYVHGIMDGEVMDDLREGKYTLLEFSIA